jgi:hypothetical protein
VSRLADPLERMSADVGSFLDNQLSAVAHLVPLVSRCSKDSLSSFEKEASAAF